MGGIALKLSHQVLMVCLTIVLLPYGKLAFVELKAPGSDFVLQEKRKGNWRR